jgi:uncharacterized membrane protein (DUF106 family)
MAQQDEHIAKLNKEKKHMEEFQKKTMDNLQKEEDKVNHLNKLKNKLEQTLGEFEDNLYYRSSFDLMFVNFRVSLKYV